MKKSKPSERNIFKVFTVVLLAYIIIENAVRLFLSGDFVTDKMIYFIGALALIIISIAFSFSIKRIKIEPAEEDTVLDLDKFDPFTSREIIVLCKILQNEKYDYIARTLNLSEITIKKTAASIYKKLACSDKLDLFGQYSNHAVAKGDQMLLETNRTETKFLADLIEKEIACAEKPL